MNRLHAVVLATVTGAAVLTPAAAHATSRPHSESRVDAAQDVVDFDFAGSSGEPVVNPTRSTGDVLASSATHAKRTVRMRMRLADLVPATDDGAYGFALRTAKHRSYVAVVRYSHGQRRASAHLENQRGRAVRCRLDWRVAAATKTVSVNVPRSCIGRPRWVRVGMGSVGLSGTSLIYLDDARTNGAGAEVLDAFPSYGGKLFH